MMKCKVITRYEPCGLECALNEWLEENLDLRIIEVKYGVGAGTETTDTHSVLIIYEDNQPKCKWYEVKDKLPKPYAPVLIFGPYYTLPLVGYLCDDKSWHNHFVNGKIVPDVTHWCQLDIPKEK